ncbi:MAG: DUF116 domain-containing protein [archaeon]
MIAVGLITILTYSAIAFAAIILVCCLVVIWIWKTNRIFFPRLWHMLLSRFEWPVRNILWRLDFNGILIDISNRVYSNRFYRTPYNKRAVFFPQCLRAKGCPAKLGEEGIICMGCGRCGLGKIRKEAAELGTKVFIVPGGSFIRRLVAKHHPWAVLGIACRPEVSEGMKMVGKSGLIPQSVVLLRDGCIDTMVDWAQVRKAMRRLD